jgi:ArsR family transcriptional regulator
MPKIRHAERQAATLFKLLADPVRLTMLRLMLNGLPWTSRALEAVLDMGQPAVAHHLRTLRDGGLIDYVDRGKYNDYRLIEPAIRQLLAAGVTAAEAIDVRVCKAWSRATRTIVQSPA